MKIKIITCNSKLLWYFDRIGEEFDVSRVGPNEYWVREGGVYNAINLVHKIDAKELNEQTAD